MAILINEENSIMIIEESDCVTGGRAELKNQNGYTQIKVTYQEDFNEFLFALSDNKTDIDGHWSDINLSVDQVDELIEGLTALRKQLEA